MSPDLTTCVTCRDAVARALGVLAERGGDLREAEERPRAAVAAGRGLTRLAEAIVRERGDG